MRNLTGTTTWVGYTFCGLAHKWFWRCGAVWAAFWLGMKRGGPAGAVLVGGFVATVPLFVEFTAMARPYATAWYFGVLAMHAAIVRAGAARRWGAGIFLGLAVGSRVEMLALAPMLLWEFWNERDARPLIWTWISVAGLAVATALLSAPWLFTQLIANLRTIATVRFGPNPLGPTSLASALLWASWNQGMAILFVLAAIAPFVHRGPQRLRLLVLAAYVACGVLSMAGGTGTIYFDQQGVILLMVILLAAWAWPLWTGWPTRVSVSAACVILLLPLLQSVRVAIQLRQSYAPDGSAAWIEEHVRPGTLVYTDTPIHRLLPTAKCAQRLWAQVTDEAAWPRKFQSGLVRFSLPAFETPRVLSEASLVQERDIPRSYFILGGEQDLPEPRFDLMPYTNSVMYGIRDSDLVKDFKQTGGVVVWHPLYGAQPPSALGKPVVQWTSPDGNSICVFCSPDVRAHARNPF
jgi:hypothetical protein